MQSFITCPCGNQFTAHVGPEGGLYPCPNCRQHVNVPAAKPTYTAPVGATVGHAAPMPVDPAERRAESMATMGFIMALVSFAFIILAPVAMVVSLMGLRSRNGFGYAVAGSLLGFLQSCTLVAGIVFLLAIGRFAWFVAEEASDAVRKATADMRIAREKKAAEAVIDKAAAAIDHRTRVLGKLPDNKEVEQLIRFHRDPWGHELKYEVNATRLATYSLVSSGPDGAEPTEDDIGKTLAAAVANSLAEALALLEADSVPRRNAALDWLLDDDRSEDEVTGDQRRNVVDGLVKLLDEDGFDGRAQQALAAWTTRAELPRLMAALSKTDPEPIIQILVSLDDRPTLLALINHPSGKVRLVAERGVAKLGIEQSAVVAQCLADLGSKDRASGAVARLSAMKLKSGQDEIAAALLQAARNIKFNRSDASSAVQLAVRLTPEQDHVTALIAVYDGTGNETAREMLLESKDPRVLAHYLKSLSSVGVITGRATDLLTAMGPEVEPAVLEKLESGSTSVRSMAIRILSQVGTTRSLPALQELVGDRFHGKRAGAAIAEIQSRAGADGAPSDTAPEPLEPTR